MYAERVKDVLEYLGDHPMDIKSKIHMVFLHKKSILVLV